MDKITYETLMRKLDSEEFKILNTHPVPTPAGNPHSAGILIHPGMDVSQFDTNKSLLLHTMLHMFYHNRSGKGLSRDDIVSLHKKVVSKLPSHEYFDKLDE